MNIAKIVESLSIPIKKYPDRFEQTTVPNSSNMDPLWAAVIKGNTIPAAEISHFIKSAVVPLAMKLHESATEAEQKGRNRLRKDIALKRQAVRDINNL